MPGHPKAPTWRRHPRFAPHGPTFHPETGKKNERPGEAKIAGRAIRDGDVALGDKADEPVGEAFVAEITEVVVTGLDPDATGVVVESWTRPRPTRDRARLAAAACRQSVPVLVDELPQVRVGEAAERRPDAMLPPGETGGSIVHTEWSR